MLKHDESLPGLSSLSVPFGTFLTNDALHARAYFCQELWDTVHQYCRPGQSYWLKVRREDYGDVLFPETIFASNATVYVYLVLESSRLIMVSLPHLCSVLNTTRAPGRTIDGEWCYILHPSSLESWGVPYQDIPLPAHVSSSICR